MQATLETHKVNEELFKIEGAPVVFVKEGRIHEATRKENLFYYDMRHADNNWSTPVTIEKKVWVNFFGTLVTTEPIELLEMDNPTKTWIYLEVKEDGELQKLIMENKN